MLQKNVSKIIIGIVFVLLALQAIQPTVQKHRIYQTTHVPIAIANCSLPQRTQGNSSISGSSTLKAGFHVRSYAMRINLISLLAALMPCVSIHTRSFEVTCEKCHGGDPSKVRKEEAHKGISNKTILRADTPDMCGQCHAPELDEFKSSSISKNWNPARKDRLRMYHMSPGTQCPGFNII